MIRHLNSRHFRNTNLPLSFQRMLIQCSYIRHDEGYRATALSITASLGKFTVSTHLIRPGERTESSPSFMPKQWAVPTQSALSKVLVSGAHTGQESSPATFLHQLPVKGILSSFWNAGSQELTVVCTTGSELGKMERG